MMTERAKGNCYIKLMHLVSGLAKCCHLNLGKLVFEKNLAIIA